MGKYFLLNGRGVLSSWLKLRRRRIGLSFIEPTRELNDSIGLLFHRIEQVSAV
jgi:hypothetical protein